MTGPSHRRRGRPLAGWLLLLVACSSPVPTGSPGLPFASVNSVSQTPAASQGIGSIIPAPGSDSSVYAPNPSAIVVAIDPGHGGCLDWGVPDPGQRGVEFSEKAMTLAISQVLRDLLEEQGVTVVMTREGDVALAGDRYPPLGCHGPAWRDVNGDGESGFDPEGAVRTRDELQARLDLANVVRADVLLSIHINSLAQDGVVFEIAATETFYTDETDWGVEVTAPLAQAIQDDVVAAMDHVARYQRQDRGIKAHNLFIVAPPLLETTPERPDVRKQPTRGALMPSILTEVGSITLRAEQNLLVSAEGRRAAAEGILAALVSHFSERPLAASYLLPDLESAPGTVPAPIDGDGPPYWVPQVPSDEVLVRVVNSGTQPWPAGLSLVGTWQASDQPYLRVAPDVQDAVAAEPLPALGPGEAIDVLLALPAGGSTRGVAWITVASDSRALTELGSPPLQVATGG